MDMTSAEWYDVREEHVFGRGWHETSPLFGRLPAHAENMLPEKVWNMGRNPSGMYIEFQTDSSDLYFSWELENPSFGEPNFNFCASSGLDLYCLCRNKWRFAAAFTPTALKNEVDFPGLSKKKRHFRLYFPFRNCLEKISVGVNPGASFNWVMPQKKPQVVYYGSSIIHGSSSSRAGSGITALLGRALETSVVNLGFSGAARLEPEMAALLTEIDSSCYIIDPLPNCDTLLVEERLEEFLRKLCANSPGVPVVFLTDADRRNAWIFSGSVRAHQEKRAAAKRIVTALQKEYPQLYFVDMARSMGSDFEGTVDGIHPDELGMVRFSSYLIRKLRALKLF